MRTLLNTRGSTGLEPGVNALIHRLERNLQDVGQLRNYLNSYSCEPQTYTDFKRIESLRNRLDTLAKVNRAIILSIKEDKHPTKRYYEKVQEQYSEFNVLKRGVEAYMEEARTKYVHH